jgi:hypothetical protein
LSSQTRYFSRRGGGSPNYFITPNEAGTFDLVVIDRMGKNLAAGDHATYSDAVRALARVRLATPDRFNRVQVGA